MWLLVQDAIDLVKALQDRYGKQHAVNQHHVRALLVKESMTITKPTSRS